MQAFDTTKGKSLLVANKRLRQVEIDLKGIGCARKIDVVDEQSGDGPAHSFDLNGSLLQLNPFAVAVLEVR